MSDQPGWTPWEKPPGTNPPVDYPPSPEPLTAAPFYLPNVIAAIVASVGIVVGSIGTWASLGPVNVGGMDFPGSWGVVTLVLGAASLSLCSSKSIGVEQVSAFAGLCRSRGQCSSPGSDA